MDQTRQRTGIGAGVLVVSTLLILAVIQVPGMPLLAGSIAAIGMALGSVLIGTASKGV
jgi:hypothetical protein